MYPRVIPVGCGGSGNASLFTVFQACLAQPGTCVTSIDGFYVLVGCSYTLGLIFFLFILRPLTRRLDATTAEESRLSWKPQTL